MLQEQVFEPGALAIFPETIRVTEQLSDCPGYRNDLLPAHKCVEAHCKMGFGGKTAGDSYGKTNFPLARLLAERRSESQVVDLRIGAPVLAAADADLEFARQIIEVRIGGKLFRHLLHQR